MSKEVNWKQVINNKIVKDIFIEESHLLEIANKGNEHAKILYTVFDLHTNGKSAVEIAMYFNDINMPYSESRIYDFIKQLKQIYDSTQLESKLLPKRKVKSNSKKHIIESINEAIDYINKIDFSEYSIEVKTIEK